MKRLLILMMMCAAVTVSAQSGKKPKKLTWDEQLDMIMPPLTEAVQLDGLQEAAIRQILMNQLRQSDLLVKETDFSNDRKRDEATALVEQTDGEVKKLLSPKQLELYEKYKTDLRSGKRPKKKK